MLKPAHLQDHNTRDLSVTSQCYSSRRLLCVWPQLTIATMDGCTIPRSFTFYPPSILLLYEPCRVASPYCMIKVALVNMCRIHLCVLRTLELVGFADLAALQPSVQALGKRLLKSKGLMISYFPFLFNFSTLQVKTMHMRSCFKNHKIFRF